MLEARCESCGACVAYCPTGALTTRCRMASARAHQVKKVMTTCTYCGVGCQFDLNVKDDKVIRVTSNPNAPVNGMASVREGTLWLRLYPSSRPVDQAEGAQISAGRQATRRTNGSADGNGSKSIGIPRWISRPRNCAKSRDTFGADSIGVLTSAKCTNEENYLMNKFARQVIGTNNIDHCARL